MASIEEKINIWKNKLLDLSKRNYLLNFPEKRKNHFKILEPSFSDLWDILVEKNKSITFQYFDDESIQLPDIENGNLNKKQSNVTDRTIDEQQKILRLLRNKSKTAQEELGINILYLSFGFLEWTEDKNSSQILRSPLLLVPVSLSAENIASPFVMTMRDDEIILNPTLSYKLKKDFNIELPEFDNDEDFSKIFTKIEEQVRGLNWTVQREVSLSALSFLKINMFNDLEIHKDKISAHPFIKALNGDTTAINDSFFDMRGFNHDQSVHPSDLFQVVDADSSQQDAIHLAKKGTSFILQGPPGTGKSQTITNIIAELLASDKKVLFVSEKMAALDVVYRRLSEAGLTDFCLTLHSHKANKKEVLEQLENAMKLADQKASIDNEVHRYLEKLQEIKTHLNNYASQLSTKVEPLGKTIFQVNGHIARLEPYEDIDFKINNISEMTPEMFDHHRNLLEDYSTHVKKIGFGYRRTNPWYAANITSITHELRQTINARLPEGLSILKDIQSLLDQTQKELNFDWSITCHNFPKLLKLLKISSESPSVPVKWLKENNPKLNFQKIEENKQLHSTLKDRIEELKGFNLQNCESIEISGQYPDISSSKETKNLLTFLEKEIEKDQNFSIWESMGIEKVQYSYNSLKERITTISRIQKIITNKFDKEIFDIDYQSMRNRFINKYKPFFKYFSSQYRKDKKAIYAFRKNIDIKVNDKEIIDILTSLQEMNKAGSWIFENSDSLFNSFGEFFHGVETNLNALSEKIADYDLISKSKKITKEILEIFTSIENDDLENRIIFDFLYEGADTDWDRVSNSLKWTIEFQKIIDDISINDLYITNICSNVAKIEQCASFHAKLEESFTRFRDNTEWYFELFSNRNEIENEPISQLINRMNDNRTDFSALEDWIDLQESKNKCINEGLEEFISKITDAEIEPDHFIPVYEKCFYRQWLDAFLPVFPSVERFRSQNQETKIDEFSRLDKLQFQIAKDRIREKLIFGLPSFNGSMTADAEINLLKREINKRRKLMPIRKLFKAIPNLLLAIKPCLMMSPLTVSLFLESESYLFDTVIFDEASQVRTENAIGAIIRGKQIIIAGDTNQLPPTNFFNASVSETDFSDDDDYDDTNAYESILDEAATLPQQTLRWHYRSKHEHLIAFSNSKIYRNSLITFPSTVEKIDDMGVEYIHVPDGIYNEHGKRSNPKEASKIAELVIEHFDKFPDRSLGVVAFSSSQQDEIEIYLRKKRKENMHYESFFDENKEEPFFIKNLENVQGDERDTIIFSIGYGKNKDGIFHMNFGPLNKSGGERRLNVAITRAKFNVKLVGSILPTDIDLSRITSEGPKLLRSYIDFAMNGPSVLLNEPEESLEVTHDSPFEESVYHFLSDRGYKVATQVGCSGFRIDMAVRHPELHGQYVLGIECDGASYHSARTARERDRLRQDVLENMGWKIYRIWSTDWIKDPITEGNKLIEAVDNSIRKYSTDFSYKTSKHNEVKGNTFLTVGEKTSEESYNPNPYNFAQEEVLDFTHLNRDRYGYLKAEECIYEIIRKRYPVHYELICKYMAPLLGKERVSKSVRDFVDYTIQTIPNIMEKDNFYSPKFPKDPLVPRPIGNTRKIEYISTQELAEVMCIIIKNTFRVEKDGLFQETANSYGFKRIGANIQLALVEALAYLEKRNSIIIDDENMIRIKNEVD
ncbi:MAG: DUF4011 domain-containing protein [Clostridiaceae bacterium]|nr:DUF4011 domain-containing protein [Clostridiaceae bacterium]